MNSERGKKMIAVGQSTYMALDALARKYGETIESFTTGIIERFINTSNLQQLSAEERRLFRRECIALPAVMYIKDKDKNAGWYRVAKIVNMSLSGMCLQVEKKNLQDIIGKCCAPDDEFEVLFSFTDAGVPATFKCSPCRVEEKANEFLIGARFTKSDPGSHSLMQRYLM